MRFTDSICDTFTRTFTHVISVLVLECLRVVARALVCVVVCVLERVFPRPRGPNFVFIELSISRLWYQFGRHVRSLLIFLSVRCAVFSLEQSSLGFTFSMQIPARFYTRRRFTGLTL